MNLTTWKAAVARLKREVYTLYLAYRDPRTPWYARVVVLGVVAYAVSPVDFIPDFIPVLGYLDDLLLVPAGLWLARRLIPPEVLADCRRQAHAPIPPRVRRAGLALVVGLWLLTAGLVAYHFLGAP